MNVDREIEGIQNQINSLIGTNTKIVHMSYLLIL